MLHGKKITAILERKYDDPLIQELGRKSFSPYIHATSGILVPQRTFHDSIYSMGYGCLADSRSTLLQRRE